MIIQQIIHEYFSDNKAGIKQNFNHLEKHAPEILSELLSYADNHKLICRNLSEIAYLYVNSITKLHIVDCKRKHFFRYSKGYHDSMIDNYETYPDVIEFIDSDKRSKLSSIEQRVMHKHYFAKQIDSMFNDFGHAFSRRIKIHMLINKISEPNKCTECTNYVKPRKSTSGFRKTCSGVCEVERTNSCRKSKFTLSTGEELLIMGYEGYVYNRLLSMMSNANICYGSKRINKHVGRISYILDNKLRKYYPDFYVIDKNLIIEVKSSYTYQADYLKNIEKAKACIDKGLCFEFWVHDYKQVIRMHADYTLETINYINYNNILENA